MIYIYKCTLKAVLHKTKSEITCHFKIALELLVYTFISIKTKLTMKALSYILFALLLWSCTTEKKEQTTTAEVSEEKLLCFRNEYPFKDNSGKMDVEELTLTITGKDVTGMYNWLPAEKDQRKGKFTGTIEGNTILAKYIFMQEGIENSTDINIQIDDKEASVSGGAPELGLESTLKKVECK